ncbi:AAA family ATPase [Lysinibacillus piscis]|uniref:Transporter n=1 Tax=Lysinibacillus piscis TaxID=2518931 RepID=A0ABQ5NI78_9BACI|nr:ATP-binding protein [Lysinibacillus sp. KH24]GLC88063.1 transporter [Lysinibacillus sp. KH24]
MLLQFTVGNYLSFQTKETFSLVATEMTELRDNIVEIEEGFSVVKSAAIYGANASGKSNLLSAMGFMRDFVVDSFRISQDGNGIRVAPFKLDVDSKGKPSCFEINFYHQHDLYRYGFEVTPKEVVKEWLYINEELIYERNQMDLMKGKLNDESIDLKWGMTRNNVLFISILGSANTVFAMEIMEYFRTHLNVLSGLAVEPGHFTKFLLQQNNQNDYNSIMQFIQALDISIDGLSVEEHNDTLVHLPKEVRELIDRDVYYEIFTEHNVYDHKGIVIGKVNFLANDLESTGTNQLISLAGPIVNTLENGGTLLIDEMDAQLHPLISEAIIKMFNSKKTNKNNAQLIITTHNITNLSNELLRRDQIWFVEKDNRERSHVVSLVEYKFNNKRVRSDEVYSRNYLKGKYGAIPLLPQEIKVLETNFDNKGE